MTSAQVTRGEARREGEAMPGADRDAGLGGRIDRMLALGAGAELAGDDISLDADLTTMLGLVENDDGTVTYCDASGRVWRRQPVAKWIAFTVARLFHQMQKETARQLGDPSLGYDARVSLARKLRRELRADALGIAFLRPDQAFEMADAHEAEDYSSPIPVPAVPGHGAVSSDLLWATEEHREARQLMIADPVEDWARTDAHIERINRLAQNLRDLPVRSFADLRHKVLYLWPGTLKGTGINEALAATFEGFRNDLERLAGDLAADAQDDQPIDFEAWDMDGTCPIPTKDQWIESADTSLVWLRVAFSLMCMDKKSLGESMADLDGEAFNETISGIKAQSDRFRALADMSDAILGRVVVALEARAAAVSAET